MTYINEPAKDTAKKIRKELKQAFKGVKFSVKSSTYSMGSSVDVNWTDGPTRKEVEEITERFNSSTFDGMQDMKVTTGYEYEGKRYNGADYIFANRTITPDYREKLECFAEEMFADFSKNDYRYNMMLDEAEKEFNSMVLR